MSKKNEKNKKNVYLNILLVFLFRILVIGKSSPDWSSIHQYTPVYTRIHQTGPVYNVSEMKRGS